MGKTEFNGELMQLIKANEALESFKVKNANLLAQLDQLLADYSENEKTVKGIAQNKVKAMNKGETKATKKDYTFSREGLEILGYPSFKNLYDIGALARAQVEQLLTLGALTIDAKVYEALLESAKIPETIDAIARKESLKSASVKIKWEG